MTLNISGIEINILLSKSATKAQFHSLRKITGPLVKLSVIWLIVFLLPIVGVFHATARFPELLPTSGLFYLLFITDLDDSLRLLGTILFFVLIFLVIWWFYRANMNIHSFGTKDVYSPSMAVVWWFVPFLNLWKPYGVTQQIWNASKPESDIPNTVEEKNSSRSMVKLWWIFWITLVFVRAIDAMGLIYSAEVNNYSTSIFLTIQMLIIITATVSTVLFIHLLREISVWQEIKAANSIQHV
jgi:hypothetical protein